MTHEDKKIRWVRFWTWLSFVLAWAFAFFAGAKWANEPFMAIMDGLLAMMNWHYYKQYRRELDDLVDCRAVRKWLGERWLKKQNASKNSESLSGTQS